MAPGDVDENSQFLEELGLVPQPDIGPSDMELRVVIELLTNGRVLIDPLLLWAVTSSTISSIALFTRAIIYPGS